MKDADSTALSGRTIEAEPYSAMIERMNRIAAVAQVASESPEGFAKGDLLNMMGLMGELAREAVVFAGASQEEAAASFSAVMGGAAFDTDDD